MDSMPLSDLLPWKTRDPAKDTFWDLHQRLGECYEREMARLNGYGSASPVPTQNLTNSSNMMGNSGVKPKRVQTALGLLELRGTGSASGAMTSRVMSPPHIQTLPARSSLGIAAAEPSGAAAVTAARLALQFSLQTSGSHFFHPLGCWTSKAKNKSRRGGTNAEALKSALAPAEPERFLFILNPTGHFRNLWDFIGICLLILDTMILPFQFVNANFYSLYPSLAVNSRIGAFYWASDIVLSFRTGYIKKGALIASAARIRWHYLRTWFIPDLIVTVIDMVLEFQTNATEANRASTRILRLLRLFRVVRLGKLTRFAAFLRDKFETQVASIQFSLVLIMMGMMLLEHVIACARRGIFLQAVHGQFEMGLLPTWHWWNKY
eukprot:symbB.v1.2.015995.t1/scaffold1193.1/size133507/14